MHMSSNVQAELNRRQEYVTKIVLYGYVRGTNNGRGSVSSDCVNIRLGCASDGINALVRSEYAHVTYMILCPTYILYQHVDINIKFKRSASMTPT